MTELIERLTADITSDNLRRQVREIIIAALGDRADRLNDNLIVLDDPRAVTPAPRPDCTLARFIQTAQRLAAGFAVDAERYFAKPVDQDSVQAILALGLAGKAVEYDEREGHVRLSGLGQTLPEGQYLIAFAITAGLPASVLNGLASLSQQIRIVPNTVEGTIAWYAARLATDLLRQRLGLPLLMLHEEREGR